MISDNSHQPIPPLISFITAVYNGGRYIEQTIQSVLNQTYKNVEHIIIDGGSTDNTLEVVKKYQSLQWESGKDNGIFDAWNKGLARVKGDWIVFLGSDDYLWDEGVVARLQIPLREAFSKNIRIVYGKVNLLSASGEYLDTLGKPWELSKKDIFHHMTIPHCASFHHQSLFSDYGLFNPQFKIAGDYEFVLREFTKSRDALFFNDVIAGMRTGGVSANINFRLIVAKEEQLAQSLNHLSPGFNARWKILKATMLIILLRVLGVKPVNIISDFVRSIKGKNKNVVPTDNRFN